jgi:predicted dehydrogenase
VSIPPSDAVRLGVVGGGLIAQLAHLPVLRALDDRFAVRALAEPAAPLRDELARRHSIPTAYADHRALLDAGGLDAVLVCSPNATHAPVVLDALDAGLHVLVEKPLCLAPADGDAIAARARETRRIVQVGHMKRFDPGFERLEDLLPSAIRAVTSATVDPGIGLKLRPAGFRAPGATRDPGALQVATALGTDDPRHVRPYSDAFLGALIHDADLVLATRPGAWEPTDAASAADASFAYGAWRHADGARWSALWQLATGAAGFREELTWHGADAVARLRFPAPYLGAAPSELTLDGEPERRWSEPANAYVRQLEHFHDCITTGGRCRVDADQGARVVTLLRDLYKAGIA